MNPAEFANIAKAEQGLWWYRGMNRILFRILGPLATSPPFRRVLEAGCGTGFLAKELTQRGWPIHAIDLGQDGLNYARQRGLTRLARSDIRQLPFRSASFDAVLSMDVLVHLAQGEEQSAFDELARVLMPGGLVVLRVAAFNMLRSRHSMHVGERQRFTRAQLLRLSRAAGLEPLRCTYANSLLLPVALTKFRIWEPLTRAEPSSGVEPVHPLLDALLYLPLALEAALIGAGLNLPLGQSILLIGRKMPLGGRSGQDSSRAGSGGARTADRESS